MSLLIVNSETKILAILLASMSVCEVNIVNASIFDRIKKKVEEAENVITSAKTLAKDKMFSVTNNVARAKEKLTGLSSRAKDAVSQVGDVAGQLRENGQNMFSNFAEKAKDAVSQAGDVAGQVRENGQNMFSNFAEKAKDAVSQAGDVAGQVRENGQNMFSNFAEKAKDAVSQAGDVAGQVRENGQNMFSDISGKIKNSNDEVNKISSTENEAYEQPSSIASNESRVMETVGNEPEQEVPMTSEDALDKGGFPEEVIAKIDKIIPTKEILEQSKTIDFEGKALTDADIPYLLERLTKLAAEDVKKISISFKRSSLSLDSVKKIFESLKAYPQFVSGLTFSGIPLGDNGAIYIASNLSAFPMLKYIFLSDMEITGNGAVAIISILNKMVQNGECNSIQVIDLSNNKITDEYLDAVIHSWSDIKDNMQMTLMLHDNQFKNTPTTDLPDNIYLTFK